MHAQVGQESGPFRPRKRSSEESVSGRTPFENDGLDFALILRAPLKEPPERDIGLLGHICDQRCERTLQLRPFQFRHDASHLEPSLVSLFPDENKRHPPIPEPSKWAHVSEEDAAKRAALMTAKRESHLRY